MPATTYFYGNGVVSSRRGGVSAYFHLDYLGSIRIQSSSGGEKAFASRTSPFGSDVYHSGGAAGAGNAYKFTGKESDVGSGLYYYGARYYSPAAGRFSAVDPLFEGRFSPYAYAYGNPLRFNDPTGLSGEDRVRGPSWWEKAFGAVDRFFGGDWLERRQLSIEQRRGYITGKGDTNYFGAVSVPHGAYGLGGDAETLPVLRVDAAADSFTVPFRKRFEALLSQDSSRAGQASALQWLADSIAIAPYSTERELALSRLGGQYYPGEVLFSKSLQGGCAGSCRTRALFLGEVVSPALASGMMPGGVSLGYWEGFAGGPHAWSVFSWGDGAPLLIDSVSGRTEFLNPSLMGRYYDFNFHLIYREYLR
ncbi:MAG: RHS repeat-associated core domain-containing protein [Candidatus Micrarchaeota archaeon]